MKIVHLVLDFEYIDDWGYQENILPIMHQSMGHDVSIITSTYIDRMGIKKKFKPSTYYSREGIKIIRLGVKKCPYAFKKHFLPMKRLYETLEQESPDFIFYHNGCSVSNFSIRKYLRKHKEVKIVVDSHADFINSAHGWFSLNVLYKCIYRMLYKVLIKYVHKYFGTLPNRCEFLRDVYKVPADKIDFLPMGIDDTRINFDEKELIRSEIRAKYGINDETLLVVFGGKIEERKKVIELITAVNSLASCDIKLLLFGLPAKNIEEIFNELVRKSQKVIYCGWTDSKETYKYFFAADLVCFPGTHSVLWEESVACGVPGLFRRWDGITHVDLGGNCYFLEDGKVDSIANEIKRLYNNPSILQKMRAVSEQKGRKKFAYSEIAKYSLES